MDTWVKPNGTELELNDQKANVAYAKSLGWKLKSDIKPKQEPKKTKK